mmetsp:Transcript_51837/g.159738  ORF Transcript_51837/g.159738 Transcript_51837/m.159738 type:complete len:212 (+) Transcript_51837:191-826(+)
MCARVQAKLGRLDHDTRACMGARTRVGPGDAVPAVPARPLRRARLGVGVRCIFTLKSAKSTRLREQSVYLPRYPMGVSFDRAAQTPLFDERGAPGDNRSGVTPRIRKAAGERRYACTRFWAVAPHAPLLWCGTLTTTLGHRRTTFSSPLPSSCAAWRRCRLRRNMTRRARTASQVCGVCHSPLPPSPPSLRTQFPSLRIAPLPSSSGTQWS